MIILIYKGKVKCIKTHKDKDKSLEELQAEEMEYYITALKGAAARFPTRAARKAFIDKVAAMARS